MQRSAALQSSVDSSIDWSDNLLRQSIDSSSLFWLIIFSAPFDAIVHNLSIRRGIKIFTWSSSRSLGKDRRVKRRRQGNATMPSKALRKPSNDGGSREESARSDQGSASNKDVPDERSGITENRMDGSLGAPQKSRSKCGDRCPRLCGGPGLNGMSSDRVNQCLAWTRSTWVGECTEFLFRNSMAQR